MSSHPNPLDPYDHLVRMSQSGQPVRHINPSHVSPVGMGPGVNIQVSSSMALQSPGHFPGEHQQQVSFSDMGNRSLSHPGHPGQHNFQDIQNQAGFHPVPVPGGPGYHGPPHEGMTEAHREEHDQQLEDLFNGDFNILEYADPDLDTNKHSAENQQLFKDLGLDDHQENKQSSDDKSNSSCPSTRQHPPQVGKQDNKTKTTHRESPESERQLSSSQRTTQTITDTDTKKDDKPSASKQDSPKQKTEESRKSSSDKTTEEQSNSRTTQETTVSPSTENQKPSETQSPLSQKALSPECVDTSSGREKSPIAKLETMNIGNKSESSPASASEAKEISEKDSKGTTSPSAEIVQVKTEPGLDKSNKGQVSRQSSGGDNSQTAVEEKDKTESRENLKNGDLDTRKCKEPNSCESAAQSLSTSKAESKFDSSSMTPVSEAANKSLQSSQQPIANNSPIASTETGNTQTVPNSPATSVHAPTIRGDSQSPTCHTPSDTGSSTQTSADPSENATSQQTGQSPKPTPHNLIPSSVTPTSSSSSVGQTSASQVLPTSAPIQTDPMPSGPDATASSSTSVTLTTPGGFGEAQISSQEMARRRSVLLQDQPLLLQDLLEKEKMELKQHVPPSVPPPSVPSSLDGAVPGNRSVIVPTSLQGPSTGSASDGKTLKLTTSSDSFIGDLNLEKIQEQAKMYAKGEPQYQY